MIKLSRIFIAAISAMGLLALTAQADESKIPEPFRGEKNNSKITINYTDWSTVLRQTVLETGRSDRRSAKTQHAPIGTRVKSGNQSSTRNEGNRLVFPAYADVEENLEYIRNIRKELEAIPSQLPMKEWPKDEQLAYWLNLYNITIIEQLAAIYPVTSLKKLMKGSKKNPSLWDRKILNVAGVPLSLNDIHHNILAEKWGTTLPMYGLFQGYIGSPNIRNRAYTGDTVRKMLLENAQEFVNSNRGMKVNGKTLEVSEFYKLNEKKFPNWGVDLKKHLISLADFEMRDRIHATTKIKAKTRDYYIADLFAGSNERSSSAASNEAAFVDMQVAINEGMPVRTGASNGITSITFAQYADLRNADGMPRLPAHVIEIMMKAKERNKSREGKVDIEEVNSGGNQN